MAAVGQRQAGPVLPAHPARPQTAGERTVEVARVRARHRVDSESGGVGVGRRREVTMTSFLRKLSWLARRRQKDAELQEELQFHLDEDTDDRTDDGVPTDEARRAARRRLGSLAIVGEDTRAAWTWTLLEQLAQDLRYGLRMLAANK